MMDEGGRDGARSWKAGDMVERDIAGREEVALRLTVEAIRETQRALVGVLALPASLALGVAASISYASAFVERGVQMFESSLARMARDARILTERRDDEQALFAAGARSESAELAKNARS